MTEEKHLIPIDTNMVTLFTKGGLDPLLSAVKGKVDEFRADAETPSGRKQIASFSHQISKTKVFIETHGKSLVAKQKAAIKLIDTERKRSRDFLDEQRDRARQPLTDYEEAEKKLIAEEAARMEFEADHAEALAEDGLFNRQREIERKEAEYVKMLEEKRIEEEAARLEREREEREDLLKNEAAAAAKKEAEEALVAEKEQVVRLKVEAKAEAARVEQEKKDAIEKAGREKEAAILQEKARAGAEGRRTEKERLAKEAVEKTQRERKALHHKHRKKIEGEALIGFTAALGCTQADAKAIVEAIKNNKIKNVTLLY